MPWGSGAVRSLSRPSAPSQGGIWISDGILQSTFNRFVRTQHGHPRGQRHYTNGPLEFRRRQFNRRMASMTFNDPSQQALPSLWPTLSHLGSILRPRPAPDTQWTWEAPAKPSRKAPLTRKESEPPRQQEFAQAMSQLSSIKELRALYWQTCPIGTAAVDFSKAAFQRVLHLADLRETSHEAFALLFEYLDSDIQVRDAGNIEALLRWSMIHHCSIETFERVTNYIADSVNLGKVATEELRSVVELYYTNHTAMTAASRISSSVSALCHSIEKWLSSRAGTRSQLTVAEGFVQLLDALPVNWLHSSTLIRSIAELPAAIRHDYNDLLCEHVRRCTQLDCDADHALALDSVLSHAIEYGGYDADASRYWWYDILIDVTNNLVHVEPSAHGLLAHWITTLKRVFHSDDSHRILWDRLDSIFQQTQSRTALLAHILQPIQDMRLAANPPMIVNRPIPRAAIVGKIATAQIHDLLAKGQVKRAARIFMATPTVTLSSCEGLLFDMASCGWTSADAFIRALDRQDNHNNVPLSHRVNPDVALSGQRIQLIENLAYHISISSEVSHRQAFRTVQALYRYLTDRNIKSGPVMSRALLRSGVTRLLRDEVLVSRDRIRWVIHRVRAAEGDAIADELDGMLGEWLENVRLITRGARARPSMQRPRSMPIAQAVKSPKSRKEAPKKSSRKQETRSSDSVYRLRGIGSRYVASQEGVRPMMSSADAIRQSIL